MSIDVILDEQWKISIDNYNNHSPYRWREVCKRIPGSRDTAPTGEYDWHSENVHFASVEQAIRLYIIPKMMQEQLDTCTMEEYCKRGKELVDYFVEKLS